MISLNKTLVLACFASLAGLAFSEVNGVPEPASCCAALEEDATTRSILFGQTNEGSAMDDYARAAQLLSPEFQVSWMEYFSLLHNEGTQAAALKRDELLAQHTGTLAAIRTGAHRESIGDSAPLDAATGSNMGLRWLATLSVMAAEQSLDNGDAESAVDAMLDGMQLASDAATTNNPQLANFGASTLAMVTNEALLPFSNSEGLLVRLDEPQCDRLAIALATIDQRLTLRISAAPKTSDLGGELDAIRAAFQETAPSVLSNIRLLRMAVAHKLTGSFSALADPFGGELEISAIEGRTKLRFRGPKPMWQRTGFVTYLE